MKTVYILFLLVTAVLSLQIGAQEEKSTWNVAIFIYEGVELLDFAGPGEVFESAGRFSEKGKFNVYTVAATADPIMSQHFVKIVPEYTIENCPKPDILVLPGGSTKIPLKNEEVIDWIKKSAEDLEIGLSVCTGAFLLSKAGLLEGKKATTWYGAIKRLREFNPNLTVLENTRFVDNGQIITTAGVSAGIDGALHVVARLLGEKVAHNTARYMEYDKWNPEEGHIVQKAERK